MNKVKLKNKIKIIESKSEKYIVKNKKKELKEIFNYFDTREFSSYPEIIEEDKNTVKYKYIEEVFAPKEEKENELIKTVALLHYKTSYYKEVSKKKYKEIYTKLINNIDILKEEYTKLIETIEKEVYPSPSHYLFSRNYKMINECLLFCERELNAWYRIVENKTKQRVSILHNNLSMDHFIRGKDNYLISWDNYVVDTPILDLYKLYKKELFNMDFIDLFKIYSETMHLTEEEKKLLYVVLSIPNKLNVFDNEIENTLEVRFLIKYIAKTNLLINADVFKVEVNN